MRALWCSILFIVAICGAQAQLTTKTTEYGSQPGYIDKATLVVQPHGAYLQQTLDISYGDHGAFPGDSGVEIVHRFKLPANAVVNDLWLWIGDTLMQAIMLDVWKARSIYDSITSSLHDPAFLAKREDAYELHIFPLISGQLRRTRINFLVPVRWAGNSGVAELPLIMLLDNNETIKPLEVMFRAVDRSWGIPVIIEAPGLVFDALPDSGGYIRHVSNIPDITPLRSMTISFRAELDGGMRVTSVSRKKSELSCFEYGIDPAVVFPVQADTSDRKRLFALDLSGGQDREFATFLPELREFLRSAATSRDSIALLVSGAGLVSRVREGWIPARSSAIDSLVTQFAASAHVAEITAQQLPLVEFCDGWSMVCWKFPGIESLARTRNSGTLLEGLRRSERPDVIATYAHNHEYWTGTEKNKDSIIVAVQGFLMGGGRLLTYCDEQHNVEIERVFFPDVKFTRVWPDKVVPIFRAANGNLGATFPEVVEHLERGYLTYKDSADVRTEVVDAYGRPVVISRRVGNGLIILTCLWSYRSDGALRSIVGAPLLGLNQIQCARNMLTDLLHETQLVHATEGFDHLIVMSNADTVYSSSSASDFAARYVTGFTPAPRVTAVNLLRAVSYTPPFVSEGGVRYYGSGLLLRRIADAFAGSYLAASVYSWPMLCEIITSGGFESVDSLRIDVVVDGGMGTLLTLREVDSNPGDVRKVRFFLGESSLADSIRIITTARLPNETSPRVSERTVLLTRDSVRMNWSIPPMLANERLRDMFAMPPPLDTAGIVAYAQKNRLLCDYTAFLVLEPEDTLQIHRDPPGEKHPTELEPIEVSMTSDSLSVIVTPNPFRAATHIAVRAPEGSMVSVTLFDVLGRAVRTLDAAVSSASRYYTWSGTDMSGTRVPAGVYFVHVIAHGVSHAAPLTVIRRVVRIE